MWKALSPLTCHFLPHPSSDKGALIRVLAVVEVWTTEKLHSGLCRKYRVLGVTGRLLSNRALLWGSHGQAAFPDLAAPRAEVGVCREPTHETLPLTRPWGKKPDGQGGSGFQGFQKGQLMRSHPWQGHEEKVWQARQIRFSGILKSCPGAHLKDVICLSDACLKGLLSNFSDTGKRPSPISSQIRINLEL